MPPKAYWQRYLHLDDHEIPRVLVVEGSWWRRDRERQRLALLGDVRELPAPDWWWGTYRGAPVVYACLYGAARAVEPVHVLGLLGTPTVVQIGSCGGLGAGVSTGDVVLPETVTAAEGASRAYGCGTTVTADAGLVDALASLAASRGLVAHRGRHVTTEVLLHQPPDLVRSWAHDGHLAVDMETSAVLGVAEEFGMRAASALHVWDELLAGRSWSDPAPPDVEARRQATEEALFPLALDAALGDGV